jgi:hypothetical protein
MSFLKYLAEGGGELSFGRANVDGMPFRGPRALLREDEYEELTTVVKDGHVAVLDLSKPEDLEKLQQIVDRAANGWYQLSTLDHKWIINEKDGSCRVMAYCVWAVPHRELDPRRASPG